ncbi:MAG: hypothetical protein KF768_01560 [Phycisphaeraceae bacterium]|nr:hypothetical protein [Phycisphaeraceae bacterium]
MLAASLWLLYAIPSYVLYPLVFRLRHGFSPVKERFPPRTRYQWVDFLLGVSLTLYSLYAALPALFPYTLSPTGLAPIATTTNPLMLYAALALWAAGGLLRVWSVMALGSNWRIGQDEADTRAAHVGHGPYRFLKHPINAALILVVTGIALLTALDTGSLIMLAVAVAYYVEQGRAEERFWSERRQRHQQ